MKPRFQFAAAAAGCRRELQGQGRRIRDLEAATAAGQAEALHDLRVAVRRLRVLLRALAGPLARTGAAALERRWQRISRELSPVRDADVWRHLLRTLPGATPAFRRRVGQRLRRECARPGMVLQGAAWARLQRDTRRLLAGPLPAALGRAGDAAVGAALRHAWKQVRARAGKLARDRHITRMEDAHKMRIACRRARYLAEFCATVADGRKAARAWQHGAAQYQALQSALGRTHDADVLLEFLGAARLRTPAAVLQALRRRRTQGLAQFKQAWRRMAV